MFAGAFSFASRVPPPYFAQSPLTMGVTLVLLSLGLDLHILGRHFFLTDMVRENGGRGRDRTYDQSIKSRMLYQLSYASISTSRGERCLLRACFRLGECGLRSTTE